MYNFDERFSWNEKENFTEMKLSTNLLDDTLVYSSLKRLWLIKTQTN